MNQLNTQSVPSIKKSIFELEVPEPGSSRFKEIAAKLLCDLLKEYRMTKDASYSKMNASRRKIYLHVVPDHHPSHI